MSGPAMLAHMLLERLSWRSLPRIPEPELVMNGTEEVAAFAACGREDGVLAPLYFFHALQATRVIRPGDTVLDLACGPANQLAQMARLNPDARFIGLDVSDAMLAEARSSLQRAQLGNVSLRVDDMQRLASVDAHSVDAVTCTLSLHHLADAEALAQTMRAVRRVLKPGGGVYLADFGRLRRRASQHYFAHDRVGEQSPHFTTDYLNSLRAAFSPGELGRATALLGQALHCHRTFLAPFLMIYRSADRHRLPPGQQALIRTLHARMSAAHRRDLWALSLWFRCGGLRLPLTLV